MRSMHPWPIFPPNLDPPAARSLSLLFILQDLIGSFKLVEESKNRSWDNGTSSLSEELAKELEKLLLLSLENSFQKGGFLDKLCFYCDILIQASKISDEALPMILQEMHTSVLRLKTKVISLKKIPAFPHPIQLSISEFFDDLERKLRSFFSALIPFLQEARTDENVLIHLIEQKQTFNRYLGPRTIEELLRRFFPAGQPHLRAVICEGFTRRGFTSFFAEKESLIEELEWEAPCHTTQRL